MLSLFGYIWIIRILKYYSRQQNKHFGDSWSHLFQVLNLTKKGTEYDIEGGTKPQSNKKERSINQKCSEFILKVTLTCIVMFVFMAYFMAISRSSNLIGNFQEFDVANVTNSPLLGSFFVSICIRVFHFMYCPPKQFFGGWSQLFPIIYV